MICPPCKRAGEKNRRANQIEANYRPPATSQSYGLLQAEAEYHHGRCEAPKTCSCQHVVGRVLVSSSEPVAVR